MIELNRFHLSLPGLHGSWSRHVYQYGDFTVFIDVQDAPRLAEVFVPTPSGLWHICDVIGKNVKVRARLESVTMKAIDEWTKRYNYPT